jgi:predicted transcriptional regulator
MRTTSIKTYLDVDLARAVTRLARAQGRSESAIVAEAVRGRFAEQSEAFLAAAKESQKRQLNRLELRMEKVLRDQAMMKECLLLFVRVWLEYNPPLDEEVADSAAASAAARFERFLDILMKGLSPGGSIASHAFDAANDSNAESGSSSDDFADPFSDIEEQA